MTKKKIRDCLVDIDITTVEVFAETDSIDEEFVVIKKQYHTCILTHHPDKGGDAATFRKVRAAFEVLRHMYQQDKIGNSFADYLVLAPQKGEKGRKKKGNAAATTAMDEEAEDYDEFYAQFASQDVPSYEWFEEAAEEEVPGYFVELARSNRSQCVACKRSKKKISKARKKKMEKDHAENKEETGDDEGGDDANNKTTTQNDAVSTDVAKPPQYIRKDAIRVGSLDDKSGSYGRWHHLSCWRVPSRIWSGLTNPADGDAVLLDLLAMDEVLFTGVTDLSPDEKSQIVEHVMDQTNWAKLINRKKKTKKAAPPSAAAAAAGSAAKRQKTDPDDVSEDGAVSGTAATTTSNAVVKVKEKFQIPRPGVNGAMDEDFLDGKTFVLTGIFPEVGGGASLNLGKDKTKRMIESFGGRVTSSVSGKTDYVVIGRHPGGTKVGEARRRGLPLMDLRRVQSLLLGETTFEAIEVASPPKITAYSAGYGGGMIANY